MGVLTRLFARSIENPSVSMADPDTWFTDWATGPEATSGIRVNSTTALTYSPVWRAVNLISRDVAKLPLVVYEREGIGKSPATTHAAHRLLKYKPNREVGFFPFKQTLTACALLVGNGYAYIMRRGDGSPAELLILSSADTYPVRENGTLVYVTKVNGTDRKLRAADVLHIRGLGDGMAGVSVVQYARDSLGLGMAAHKNTAKFFANSARPSVVLETPGELSPEAKANLKESWERMHRGLDNAHRTALLEQDIKAKTLSMSARDMQWLETRQHEVREVANWFGVPPHKLGDTTRTAFASLEQENQSYLDESLDPWLVTWECECRDKLLTEPQKQRDTHIVEFTRNALVRADIAARYAAYSTAITNGIMSPNEVRSRENLNPREGGDEYLVPMNMQPSGGDDAGDPQDDDTADADDQRMAAVEAHRTLIEDAARRMCNRLKVHALKADKRGELAAWLESGMDEHREVIREAIDPTIAAAAAVTGVDASTVDVAGELFGEVNAVLCGDDPAGDAFDSMTSTWPSQLADKVMGEDD